MILLLVSFIGSSIYSQEEGEQSRESMAVDATATQWSYQFALEGFYDYRTDIDPATGEPRVEGRKGFLQFRWVAPIPKSDKLPLTLLPRLTFRLVQNAEGDVGFGSSDVFILGIINQWKTGRWGIGPQINFPSMKGFGNPNWGYGLAAAVTQRAWKDRLFFAFLVQQTWSSKDGTTKASPVSINPIFVIQLGKGWYAGNGDYVINYNWYSGAWFIPFGARLGKAFIGEKTTWNAYVEYSTSALYEDWYGPVATHAFRVNVQFQIPVGL